ncbi:MAG TPA: penicillin acylase family protein, partial [Actinomycetota bacterium]|nr:penicillin acylase family protein [Actinomycetota bacterium]
YLYNGNWERMECRTEIYAVKGVQFDQQEICRTRHGPVLSFDVANNRAYSVRYAWMNQERGTVEGFFRFNEARSLEDFATYANLLASNHNMFYADDQGNIGYWHPGNFPRRPAGDLRLPYIGTGEQEWLGLLGAQEVPHAVNPPRGWLANWNNKPSIDWDRENGWGAVHGVQTFLNNLDENKPALEDPFGGQVNPDRSVSWQDLNANIRYAAFRDFNADFFQQYLPATGSSPLEDAALAVVRDYNGFIYDQNGDGLVDSAGFTILPRFVTELRKAVFDDDLSGVPSRANTSTLAHVMNPATRFDVQHDWLGGETRAEAAARAFTATVKALRAQFGNDGPRTWKSAQPEQKYTRLNADLATDIVRTQAGRKPGSDPFPGNVPNHIRMNRGTYNHLVTYLDPPSGSGTLGESRTDAGSVIAPGQSGFIDLTGKESPHSRDQFDLYVQWRYKPMPMTLAEARAVAESEVVIAR